MQAEQEVAQLRESLEQEQATNRHEEQRVSLGEDFSPSQDSCTCA